MSCSVQERNTNASQEHALAAMKLQMEFLQRQNEQLQGQLQQIVFELTKQNREAADKQHYSTAQQQPYAQWVPKSSGNQQTSSFVEQDRSQNFAGTQPVWNGQAVV